ncbi:hypothetical protein ABLE68_06685 [Nocardioides sp. CN2-186]|uniref:hypothetical protein n=1 Tax=Nocardioides tweenelious TaxID=3156607 RepID=UPI0032B53759
MSINADTQDQAGSPAAARLLEITARETDEWRAEARRDADAILASAREESERLLESARLEVAHLRQLATEHREQMRQHLTDMLGRVEASPSGDDR